MRTRGHDKAQRGVAALEFALVLPLLILMFVLMIDGFSLIYTHRKLAQTSDLVARLVGFETGTITPARIGELFRGASFDLRPLAIGGVTIEIRDYYLPDPPPPVPAPVVRWTRSSKSAPALTAATAPACAAPDTSNLLPLVTGTDAILVVVCADFTPPKASILSFPNLLGFARKTITQQSIQPLRQYGELLCPTC